MNGEMQPIFAAEDCRCAVVSEGPSIADSPGCPGMYLFMLYLQSYLWGRCDITSPCKRIVSAREHLEHYDFIVVGSGVAGSIVAGRLSEDGTKNVLLIEAGGPEPIAARVPSFYPNFWGDEQVDWAYRTELGDYCLDQGLKGCNWPRGKVLGGSAVFNGMMYHRGHAADYDTWVSMGAKGWSWDELQPYFDMTEGNKEIGTRVNAKYHSDKGPLPVQTFNYQPYAAQVLLRAINQSGFPVIKDMNDPHTPDGYTIAQTFNYNGQRYTTARAYLEPESVRPNLKVLLHSHVSKVLFKGHKAVGVKYITTNGRTKTVHARKEVILSAGALNSPQILMLSGVGPRRTLEHFNIPVIADLPVGQNLRNHVGVTMYFLLTQMNYTRALDWSSLTEYLLTRRGPMSSTGITQLTGFGYSSLADPSLGQPDIQFFFNGFYADCSHFGIVGETRDYKDSYNVTANAALLLPRSVGYLTLNSTDPFDKPLFVPKFFEHPDDMVMGKDAMKHLHKIYSSQILQDELGIKLDPEYAKECENVGEEWSDKWNECMIRLHTDPQNHQLGTTGIGMVVDPELRVYKVQNLRVCDAGSMPSQPTGNPQGAIMVVAEKCAALIQSTWDQD